MDKDKELVEFLKREYPSGTRVRLIRMDDSQAPPLGTEGTVTGVDDMGSLLVVWDNGSHLNVIHGVDEVQKLMEKIYVDDKHRFYTIQPYKGREEKKKGLWTIKIRCDDYVKSGWMIWSPYYKYETAVRRLDQEAKFNQWKEVKK